MTITKQPISLKVNACLFDVDGTIIISKLAVQAFWRHFADDKPEIEWDYDHVIKLIHGRRTYDAILEFAPSYATVEYANECERSIPAKYGEYSVEVPGAVKLCQSLNNLPKEKWSVATSGTKDLATQWFKILDIKKPSSFITANDVDNGKPHPEPYLKGRNNLGYPINVEHPELSKAVVFEDAPAGITAGKDAGCKIIGIATTFSVEDLKKWNKCDIIVNDLTHVRLGGYDSETDEVELIFEDYEWVSPDFQKW